MFGTRWARLSRFKATGLFPAGWVRSATAVPPLEEWRKYGRAGGARGAGGDVTLVSVLWLEESIVRCVVS